MDFGALLMGGFGEVANEQVSIKQRQAEFNIKQQEADADVLRKENFARFGHQLNVQEAKDKRALQVGWDKEDAGVAAKKKPSNLVDPETGRELTIEEVENRPDGSRGLIKKEDYAMGYEKKKAIQNKSMEKAGWIDPKTKRELTNEEVEKRPNGVEGLITKEDYDLDRSIEKSKKLTKSQVEARVELIKERFPEGDPNRQRLIDKVHGAGRDEAEISDIKSKNDFMKQINSNARSLSENSNLSPELASIVSLQNNMESASNSVIRSMKDEVVFKKAKMFEMVVDGVAELDDDQLEKLYNKGGLKLPNGKKVPKGLYQMILDYREYKAEL